MYRAAHLLRSRLLRVIVVCINIFLNTIIFTLLAFYVHYVHWARAKRYIFRIVHIYIIYCCVAYIVSRPVPHIRLDASLRIFFLSFVYFHQQKESGGGRGREKMKNVLFKYIDRTNQQKHEEKPPLLWTEKNILPMSRRQRKKKKIVCIEHKLLTVSTWLICE